MTKKRDELGIHHCVQCFKELWELEHAHSYDQITHISYVCNNEGCPNFGLLALSVELLGKGIIKKHE